MTAGRCRCRLFDNQDFAEITTPDYPGERLICCHNPALAAERARNRADLLGGHRGGPGQDRRPGGTPGGSRTRTRSGSRAGKVINKRKVAKHFILDIGPGRFTWRRDQDDIAAEAALDGIYVIRTSVPGRHPRRAPPP